MASKNMSSFSVSKATKLATLLRTPKLDEKVLSSWTTPTTFNKKQKELYQLDENKELFVEPAAKVCRKINQFLLIFNFGFTNSNVLFYYF